MSDIPSSPSSHAAVAAGSPAIAAPFALNFTSPNSVLRSDRHPNQSRFAFTASSPVADESFPAISSSSIATSGDNTAAPSSSSLASTPLPPRLNIPSTPSPRPSLRDSASPSHHSLTTPLLNSEDLPSFLPGRSPSQLAAERARRAAEEAAREERLRGVQARKKQEATERASPIKYENGYLQPFAKQPTSLHQRSPHSNSSLDSPWRSLPPFNSSPRRSPSASPSPAALPAAAAAASAASIASTSTSNPSSSSSVRLTADALKQLPATPASEKVRMARAASGGVESQAAADDSESHAAHHPHIQITPDDENEEERNEVNSSASPSNCSCCSCEGHDEAEEDPNSDDEHSICSCSVATDSESEFGSDCSDCDDEMVDENKRIIEAVHSVKSSFVYLPLILQSMVGMWLGQKLYTLGCNALRIPDSIEQSRMQDLLLDGDAWKAQNETVTTTSATTAK